jgi:hypothetical protein
MPPIDGKDSVHAPGLFFEVAAADQKARKACISAKKLKKNLNRCSGAMASGRSTY